MSRSPSSSSSSSSYFNRNYSILILLGVMTTTLLLLSSSSWKKEDEVKEKDEHESEEVVEGEEEEGEEEQEETTPPPPPTITRVDPMTVIGHPHPFLHTEEDYAGCLYFDYNATTPIYAEVYQAMLPYLTTTFGNPSSSHIYGRRCAEAVKEAREQVAKMINATHPHEEILFTSCGTESDNDAIKIAIHHYYHHHHHHQQQQQHDKKEIPIPHIITSTIEHPAIINYLRVMELRNELRYSLIPVNEEGYVDIQVLTNTLTEDTALVTIMHSNNEVGSIQPIRHIGQIIQGYNELHKTAVLFHSDAAQSIGKVNIDIQQLQVDMLTIVGHKYGAPKGVSALYIKKGIILPQLLMGGGQERGIRSGTEAVPNLIALGKASQLVNEEINYLFLHYLMLRIIFLEKMKELFNSNNNTNQLNNNDLIIYNGSSRAYDIIALSKDLKLLKAVLNPFLSLSSSNDEKLVNRLSQLRPPDRLVDTLPNTISISFKGLIGHDLVEKLSHLVACSAGSACHSQPSQSTNTTTTAEGDDELSLEEEKKQKKVVYVMSDVLKAMNAKEIYALGTLRLSFGRHTSVKDVEEAARRIHEVVTSTLSSRG